MIGGDNMICPNCGQPLPDTAKMCYSCKTKFETKAENKPEEKPGFTPGGIILAIITLIIAIYLFYLALHLGEAEKNNIFGAVYQTIQYL